MHHPSLLSRGRNLERSKQLFNAANKSLLSWTALCSAYAQNGQLQSAARVFNAMPQRDAVAWNTILAAYSKHAHLEWTKAFFDTMPERTAVSYNCMLSAYSFERHLDEAKCVYKKMPAWSINSSNTMLSAYARSGDVQRAQALYITVAEPNLVTGNTMLYAYASNGYLQYAKQVFDGMDERNVVSWTMVLHALSENYNLEEARAMFEKMPAWDNVLLNTMIAINAQNGRVVEAKALFDMLGCDKGIIPWTSILQAYINDKNTYLAKDTFSKMPAHDAASSTVMLSAIQSVEAAKEMFDSLPESNVFCWIALLTVYTNNSSTNAFRLFRLMPKHNSVSSTLMLAVFCESRSVKDAAELFDSMLERDVTCWTSLIAAFAAVGHFEMAGQALSKMPETKVMSWNVLLASHAQAGNLEIVLTLFRCMPERNIISWNTVFLTMGVNELDLWKKIPQFNLATWNLMLTKYAQLGKVKDAKSLFDIMPERDIVSWTSMLTAYAQTGNTVLVNELLCKMHAEGVPPDSISYTPILAACSHMGNVENGIRCFISMAMDHNIEPERHHYACIVDLLARAGHLEDAENLLNNMPYFPETTTWQALLGASNSQKDVKLATRAAQTVIEHASISTGSTPYVVLANILAY